MMGLEDGDGGIMSRTSGNNSGPTQANLKEIANDICGANPCPDSCCCGNGQIDSDRGEGCDPFASPAGCNAGEACCPVCCSCFAPVCVPANGEFLNEADREWERLLNEGFLLAAADCWNRCGSDSTCYKNYKTGCWDCVKQETVITGTCSDPENIRGNIACDHEAVAFGKYASDISQMFGNERINLQTVEGDTGNIVTTNNVVEDYGGELLEDPTVTVTTDRETISLIAGEHLSLQQAMATDRVRIEGQGLLNGFKFFVYDVVFDIFSFFAPAPEVVVPEIDTSLPDEYLPFAQPESNLPEDDIYKDEIGELPDLGLEEHG